MNTIDRFTNTKNHPDAAAAYQQLSDMCSSNQRDFISASAAVFSDMYRKWFEESVDGKVNWAQWPRKKLWGLDFGDSTYPGPFRDAGVDHGFTITRGGEIIAVGWEPYGIAKDEIQALNSLIAYGLRVAISARSQHFPCSTVRVLVWLDGTEIWRLE